jgi:small GTP-binding protein
MQKKGKTEDITIKKTIKVLCLGDGAVGKTSLIRRFAQNKFEKSYLETLGVDITDKIVSINEKNLKMVIWDIAGQDRYKTYRSAFYQGTEALIVVADVTNPATFDNLQIWKSEIDQFLGIELPTIFLANKCDLQEQRKVLNSEVMKVGKLLMLKPNQIFETSALEGLNVNSAFDKLADLSLRDII